MGTILTQSELNQGLFLAVQRDQVHMCQEALRLGADLNGTDGSGQTALQLAIRLGRLRLAEALAAAGADTRALSPDDRHALSDAAAMGNLDAFKLVCTYCADLEPPAPGVRGLLEQSLSGGELRIAEYLVRHGADVEDDDAQGCSLLARMAAVGDRRCVAFLLAAGADPLSTDILGRTPLDRAIAGAHVQATRLLLHATPGKHLLERNAAGHAGLAVSDEDPTAPRSVAVRARSAWLQQVVRWHIGKAAVRQRMKARRTQRAEQLHASLFTAIHDHDLELLCRTLADGADPNARDKSGDPAIIAAARQAVPLVPSGSRDAARAAFVYALLEAGAHLDAVCPVTGGNLLHVACANDNVPLLRLAMAQDDYAWLLNRSDFGLNRPLHCAVKHGTLECVYLLAASGADMNAVNRAGFAPLHLAAESACAETAEILIVNGANINLKTRDGRTIESLLPDDDGDRERFLALLEARRAINGVMSIFSANNPLARVVRGQHNHTGTNNR